MQTQQEPVTTDELMGWRTPGTRAVWVPKSGKQRVPVQIQMWVSGNRVRVQTPAGEEFEVPPDRLEPWTGKDSVEEYKARSIRSQAMPKSINPDDVRRITVKVRGKLRYSGPVTKKAGEMLTLVAAHGRHMVVTLKMKDGSKRRFRGNGSQLL